MSFVKKIIEEKSQNLFSRVIQKLHETKKVRHEEIRTKPIFEEKLSLIREMAALSGRGSDPNADEKTIVDILQRIHDHGSTKERNAYIRHPQGVLKYAEDHMMSGHAEYDAGTRAAASAAQAIMNHETKEHGAVRDIFKKRTAEIARSGIQKAEVQPEYKKLGGKNPTSRADIAIRDTESGANHSFSVKKGSAQVASAESGEFTALGHAAVDKYTKDPKVRADLKARIKKIAAIQKASETAANDDEYREHSKKANNLLQKLRKEHPQWEHHVSAEASTGHAKFGKGREGSADNMLSYDEKTGEAKIWKSEEGGTPYPYGVKMEIRAGKGRKGKRDPKSKIDKRARRQIAFRVEPNKAPKQV